MIECCTLGTIGVKVDGENAPTELMWRKNLSLLIYLARSPSSSRSRDHLIGLLWSDKPQSSARHSLRESVRVVRQSAGDGLQADATHVRIEAGTVALDTDDLERLATAEDWEHAAELVRGEFLEGFSVPGASEFEDWLAAERIAWRRRSLEVLVRRADQLLGLGDLAQAAAISERALALDPTSNVAVRRSMTGLALAGERAAALNQYEVFRQRLADLGIKPDQDTVALSERVRNERRWKLPTDAIERRDRGAESRRTPLVGRAAELERLAVLWTQCREGAGHALAIVEGDPGTGKTRLGEELLNRARLDGAAISSIRAVPADSEEAGSGMLSLILGGLLTAPGASAADTRALASIIARAPESAEQFPSIKPDSSVWPLSQAFRDLLRAVTENQPAFLMVDDGQWLDTDSLRAMHAALRDLRDAPLFALILSSPNLGITEIDQMGARIGRDVTGIALQLDPLGASALRSLAAWAIPEYDNDQLDRLARRIEADSAGLPLLAVELLHAIALGLDLSDTEPAWPEPLRTLDQTLPADLPQAVVAAIRVGFRGLSANAQKALVAAAVLGDRVSEQDLVAGSGVARPNLAASLDELEWERWLVADPRGFSFVARVVRDVVLEDLVTAGQRRRILEQVRGNEG